jgi:hypothetical protein
MRVPLTGVARMLRQRETRAEQLLWRKLRARQVDGWKFKRQVPHGPYILDFYCADAGLAIGQQQAPSPGALRRQKSVGTRQQARRPLPEGRGANRPDVKDVSNT